MSRHNYRRDGGPEQRQGVALVLALAAIVVIGALIVNMFFASSLRGRIATASFAHVRAMAAADYGANEALLSILDFGVDSLAIGATSPPITGSIPGGGSTSATVTRLQENLFLLVTEGAAGSPGSTPLTRRTGFLFRMILAPADSADSTAVAPTPMRVRERAWTYLF